VHSGSVELRLDERQCRRAVLVGIALVRRCVVAVAAVRVGRVAVRLDVTRVWAFEAARTGSEL
jgi:hypothetical protein